MVGLSQRRFALRYACAYTCHLSDILMVELVHFQISNKEALKMEIIKPEVLK